MHKPFYSIIKRGIIRTIKFSFFLTATSTVILTSALVKADETEVEHQKVTIWSQGSRLAADIYKPKGLAADAKIPGILMVPGWGGSKNNIGEKYAPYFAKQGFLVLTFDFRTWGESEGHLMAVSPLAQTKESAEITVKASHIREIINPFNMAADVRAALHYLGGEPQVMANNLGIWGTSMGGGLGLVVAANDNRVKAFVSQMSPVNYKHNIQAFSLEKMRMVETLAARGVIPPYPGPQSKVNPHLDGFVDWVAMKRFDPLQFVEKLNAATLIIDAQEEALFEIEHNGQLLYKKIKDRVESKYISYPGKHYDMYKGENLENARNEALGWFKANLKK
ncbi:MAG: alpha/beta hydrolase [Colwellia sp.]